MRLAQAAVGTGTGTLIYTTPNQFRGDLKDLFIANTTADPIDFALYLVPAGGTPAADNMIFPNVAIPGNTTVHWSGSQTTNSLDFVQAIGSALGITVTLSGDVYR